MKRRDFLRNSIPAGVILPSLVGGFSFKAFSADSDIMQSLMLPVTETDHVFVIIQLNGGNDGFALVAPNTTVLELWSYEGTFTAGGRNSIDVGVAESGSTLIGQSLARVNFTNTWVVAMNNTKGLANTGWLPANAGRLGRSPTTVIKGLADRTICPRLSRLSTAP